ncbi:MAG TPA: PQQ-binding-like beta-propeller repeat protein [Chloroflexia bacterium]|nr:PQQ-binding-like beta-propeller repeat protein [Chloroflexia bacterium]
MRTPTTRIGAVLVSVALVGLLGMTSAAAPAPRPGAPTAAGDWPMYGHDPQHTSYNAVETTISAANLAQLISRWQFNVGSNGTPPSGAPSVANGRVYVGSSTGTGPNFFAFDAITGAQVFTTSVGYVSSCFNVGIGSTSAISGSVVTVGGGDAAYYGLDANSGAQLWRQLMNVGPSGFAWESPVVGNGRSYIGMASRCDNPSVRGEIRALDLTTGTQLANQYFVPSGQAGAGIWQSPALSPDNSTILIDTGEDYNGYNGPYTRAMVSLDALSLTILQSNQQGPTASDSDFGTSPVVFHDSTNRLLVGANHKDGTFYTYLVSNINGGPLWSLPTGTSVGMMAAYDPSFGSGGTLFIYGGSSHLYAVDPATGANRWTTNPITVGAAHGNMAIANGLIFLNAGNGGLQIRSEADGSLLRTLAPANAGAANSGLAVANGFIYWLSGSYMNAWSLPPGTPTPTATPGGPSPTPTATQPPAPTATHTATAPPPTATRTVGPPSATVTPGGPSATPTNTPGGPTNTPAPSNTPGGPTNTPAPSNTPGGPTATATVPAATSTPCSLSFTDVHATDYFYTPVLYLACHGVISGYSNGDGTFSFRPYNNTTRAQMVKIVVLGFSKPIVTPAGGNNTFADVPPSQPFFSVIETAAADNIVSGYTCGGPGEPCDSANRPYFRPYTNVTRGQLAKIIVTGAAYSLVTPAQGSFTDVLPGTAFYPFVETAFCHGLISGYNCGGPGEPCDSTNRPYYRQYNQATRGQIAKIQYGALTSNTTCGP